MGYDHLDVLQLCRRFEPMLPSRFTCWLTGSRVSVLKIPNVTFVSIDFDHVLPVICRRLDCEQSQEHRVLIGHFWSSHAYPPLWYLSPSSDLKKSWLRLSSLLCGLVCSMSLQAALNQLYDTIRTARVSNDITGKFPPSGCWWSMELTCWARY